MNMEKLENMISEAFSKDRAEQETIISKELSGGKKMSKKVEMFQCERCGRTFSTEYYAEECEFTHKKEDFANYMFRNGYCLRMIQAKTGVLYGLPEELYAVDTETKFEIGYLQGRDGYIYEINHICNDALEVVNPEDSYESVVSFDALIRGMEK